MAESSKVKRSDISIEDFKALIGEIIDERLASYRLVHMDEQGYMYVFTEESLLPLDSGFEAGMKFILEQVSPKHQVIILTCHRQRHQWLRDNDPEWWQKFISEVRLSSP